MKKKVFRFIWAISKRDRRRLLYTRIFNLIATKSFKSLNGYLVSTKYGTIVTTAKDTGVTPTLISYGHFQGMDLDEAIAYLKELGIKSGGFFLDIGAHIGTSSIAALKSNFFSRAYCFEPLKSNHRLLRANIILNDLETSASVYNFALSTKSSRTSICKNPRNSGDNRIDLQNAKNDPLDLADSETFEMEEIKTETYDSIAESFNENVSLAWIDTQGHEFQVLSGASTLLERGTVLFMEFWPYMLRRNGTLESLIELLSEHYTHFISFGDLQRKKNTIDQLKDFAFKLSEEDDSYDLLVFGQKKS